MATRWGIVSAGKISNDFVAALKLLPESEHQVVAVAARNAENAQTFAKRFGIPKCYGSYEEMTLDKEIDIAYIGAIHVQHLSLCKMFISSGFNVLCEKPMTMNAKEAKQIFEMAKKHGVFFMEGYWSRFFPVYADLQNVIKSGDIGTVEYVSATFGYNVIGKIERVTQKELGGGGLLDMGCYTIQLAQMVFNHEKPQKIIASGVLNEESGVDETVTATLIYSDNRVAVVSCSAKCILDQCATICGSKTEKNIIKLEYFWCPETMVTPDKTYSHPLPKSEFPLNYRKSEGLMYEAQAVRESLLKGLKEHPLMTWEMSLNIQEILDEIRKQIGLVYSQDQP